MKGKELGKLICIDCIFMVLLFACTYLLCGGQIFVTGEMSEHFFDYTGAQRAIISNLNAIAHILLYPLLSLLHAFAIYRLVRCPNIKRLIVLNSIAFCIAVIAINSALAALHMVHFYVYLSIPSSSVSVMVTQMALALLFIRKDNGAMSAVDRGA